MLYNSECYCIANIKDNIRDIWEKTKELIESLGYEDDAENLSDEIENMTDEELEEFFVEEIIPFMNEISPDNDLVFGVNIDGDIGFWNFKDIDDGSDEFEDYYDDRRNYNPENESEIIRACFKCRKILEIETNLPTEKTIDDLTDKEKKLVSHGLCEDCLEKYYPTEKE